MMKLFSAMRKNLAMLVQENKVIVKLIMCTLLSLLGYFGLAYSSLLPTEPNILAAIVFLALFTLFYFTEKWIDVKHVDLIVAAVALIYACCMLVGVKFALDKQILCPQGFVCLAGSFVVFYCFLRVLWYLVNLHCDELTTPCCTDKNKRFRVALIAILVLWLPYYLAYLPANVPYDGIIQLNMYYGLDPFTSHHPVITTLIIGWITNLGWLVGGSLNFGLALFSAMQVVLCALIYAYIISYIGGVSKFGYILSVLFFGVVPMWGSWAVTIGKDTLYFALFALFVFEIGKCCRKAFGQVPSFGIADLLPVLLVGLFLSLFRKESLIIVAVSLAALLFISSKRALTALCIVAVIAANFGLNHVASFVITGENSQSYEMWSVPFQQTARTVLYEGDTLSKEEIAAVDTLLGYDTLAERYNPINADPVKDRANKTTSDEFADYLHTWLKMGLEHPMQYLAAWGNQTFGYWYPFYKQDTLSDIKLGINVDTKNEEPLPISYIFNDGSGSLRTEMTNYIRGWENSPLLSLSMSCGLYTWALIALALLALKRGRRKYLITLIPCILCFAVCMASPVNAYLRYMMPIMAAMPFVIIIMMSEIMGKSQ